MIICLEGIVLHGIRALQPAAVDWSAYRLCPTCRAATGTACAALNGRVAGGVPDGVRTPLERPHAMRRRRRGR